MEKVRDLLKGNFWILDLSKVRFGSVELDFLSYFFDISCDHVVDDLSEEERAFLILQKKTKYIRNPLVN